MTNNQSLNSRRSLQMLLPTVVAGAVLLTACSPYEMRHDNQSDARTQIWLSEESQVKVRAAQTRVFDTKDRRKMLQAIIMTLQDLNCKIDVLDEELGIVSAKKYLDLEQPTFLDPSYVLYRPDTLLFLTRTYRAWGPFYHRSDLVRLTVTVRDRNESQLIVRASAQFYLRAVEDPVPYQQFFRTLEQAIFLEGHTVE
ncbi:MAG: hypothetical protein Nkreftii_000920 [Candidatus Nitrospira kreftii]|uniref:Uncharacterized protein n=1 Tax=Candidatus Nitrospira kreftii TaxID=2652173 RepID=A0A7S8FC69_9BACT|nr:MAG: hypothetical protein Nkreftii_000920 [Candidatus Nitrospira kreftii]